MGWKLSILVSICLLENISSGQESKTSDNEVISASSQAPDKSLGDWFANLIGITTTTLRPINDPPEDCPACGKSIFELGTFVRNIILIC